MDFFSPLYYIKHGNFTFKLCLKCHVKTRHVKEEIFENEAPMRNIVTK